MPPVLAGLWPPVSTPFADGEVDYARLTRHGKALLADGATGLALLGTTSEANSLTLEERRRAIDAYVDAGIPAAKLLPGTGASAIGDAAALTRHAGEIGAAGVLLLPPFFYKKVSDEGLFAFVARVVERSGPKPPRIMLYHIPPVAIVGWSLELIARLREAFPEIIVGIKDSSGDFENTRSLIEAFPGFAVFPGAEIYLVKAMAAGAAGCISASANVNARGISRLVAEWNKPDATAQQQELNAVRAALERTVMIPSLKAIMAERYSDPAWRAVRPPLVEIADSARQTLFADPSIQRLIASYEKTS